MELDTFRAERLALLEPRAEDFLLAQSWLRLDPASGLRADDALHLAVAHRQGLTVVSADHVLVNAARRLDLRAELVGWDGATRNTQAPVTRCGEWARAADSRLCGHTVQISSRSSSNPANPSPGPWPQRAGHR